MGSRVGVASLDACVDVGASVGDTEVGSLVGGIAVGSIEGCFGSDRPVSLHPNTEKAVSKTIAEIQILLITSPCCRQ
jgi:hypothetical protein